MAGEKHKGEVWPEFPQPSLSSRDKDAILLQGGRQVELMEKVPNWGTRCGQNEQPNTSVKSKTGWLMIKKELLQTDGTGSDLEFRG